jgi:acyl transferase domain-containing protein/phosphopantetheinyl transferase
MKGRKAFEHDVAVIGMAALFPKAPDLLSYWQNILDKVDAVDEAPKDWEEAFYYGGPGNTGGTYTKAGGFLKELSHFDPAEFGVMPGAVDGGIPEQFLALRVARDALYDAGYADRPFDREKTGVIVGYGTYYNRGYFNVVQHGLVLDQTVSLLRQFCPEIDESRWSDIRAELEKSLPPLTPEVVPALVPNILTGRIANRLNVMGPNFTIDAACASSLIAVDLAMRELAARRCDMVIAGGVNASNCPQLFEVFNKIGALSRSKIRPFCQTASGTLLGEGVGMVVIKRLADAEKDGDRIYAVIKSTGVSSDGKGMGLLAPRREGEVLALRRAYAGIEPETVSLIEAHGTGMPLGDETEIRSLTDVFGRRSGPVPPIALGSVKSMIGHCIPAAGIASMIKIALALYHKILPPTLHETVNPDLKIEETPFYINTDSRPWIQGDRNTPRRAGINSFGFGGINAHAVMEEYLPADDGPANTLYRDWPTELIVLSSESASGIRHVIGQVMKFLDSHPEVRLADVAYTLSLRPAHAYRIAVVARSVADMKEKLEFISRNDDFDRPGQRYGHRGIFSGRNRREGEIAFLFPGENSQYVNMLGDLCLHFPQLRGYFDLLDEAFADEDIRPGFLIFPPANSIGPETLASMEKRLYDMDVGALSVFTADFALFDLLSAFAIPCDAMLGHSSGENAALLASDVFHLKKGKSLVDVMKRCVGLFQRLMGSDAIPRGVLMTVGGVKRELVDEVIDSSHGRLARVMDNCPNQVVIFGERPVVDDAIRRLQGIGGVCIELPFGRGYHSSLFHIAVEDATAFLEDVEVGRGKARLYSCSTAKPFPDDPEEVLRCVRDQWSNPVRFRETIERMYEDGVRTFIEVGPSSVLTSFVHDILQGREYSAMSCNHPRKNGLEQLQSLLGGLFVSHVPLNMEPLYRRRGLVDHPFESPGSDIRGQKGCGRWLAQYGPVMRLAPEISRNARGDAKQESAPAVPTESAEGPNTPWRAESTSVRDEASRARALKSHFALMREFLANQARVMEQFSRRSVSTGEGSQKNRTGSPFTGKYPLLGKILTKDLRSLTCENLFDLDSDIFLRDHSEGGCLSKYDGSVIGFSFLPLTASAEIAAEAAHCLCGGSKEVVSLTNLRSYRWLALHDERLLIRIKADLRNNPDAEDQGTEGDVVHVCISEVLPSGDEFVSFQAEVTLASEYPVQPCPPPFALTGERPYGWTDIELYGKGMFHGPTFQAVKHIRRWGQEGIEADLEVLSREPLVRSGDERFMRTDAIILDACGQLPVFWTFEFFGGLQTFYPYQVRAIHLYSGPLAPGTRLTARATVVFPKDDELESQIEVLDDYGKTFVRVEGWGDKRWIFSDKLYECRMKPQTSYFSEPWMASEAGLVCRYVAPQTNGFMEETAGIGKTVLAHLMLNRKERGHWYGIPERGPGRMEWLMGRIAAKDAVRQWAAETLKLSLAPVDIEIQQTDAGKPFAVCPLVPCDIPDISLSHSDGHAVAAMADPGQSIGIDYQRMARINAKELQGLGFGREELTHLRGIDPSMLDRAIVTLWSVKEAAAKAAGAGLGGRPEEWKVEYFSLKDGRASVVRDGELFSCRFWMRDEFAFSLCTHLG